MSSKLADAVGFAVTAQAKGNSHTAAPAVAVLWPDKERQWEAALPALKQLLPGLLELGAFDLAARSGPAVWLKCAIAGVLPEVQFQAVPAVYPRHSRSRFVAPNRTSTLGLSNWSETGTLGRMSFQSSSGDSMPPSLEPRQGSRHLSRCPVRS